MALFTRRDRPPAELIANMSAGERVVSWADGPNGEVVLATPKGLWWPSSDGGAEPHRLIGWQYIDKAVWRDNVLTVIEADVVDDLLLIERAPISLELSVPRDLPPTVRKRVDANVVRTDVLPITGGAARFVARRIPGQDGLVWWARLEPGTRDDEAVRSAVAMRIAELRASAAVQV